MKKNITFFLIITHFSAFAQIPADYEKLFPNSLINNELGFNKDRLNSIESGFQELISKEQIPGAVALVVRNGKIRNNFYSIYCEYFFYLKIKFLR